MVAQARHGGALVHRRLGADGARDDAPDDRLGDHLAVHAASRAGRDGRARRAGGRGPGRFILGFGTSKIFLNNAGMQTSKTLGPMRDAVEIVRGVLGGEAFEYTGSTWNANVPALQAEAHAPRERAAGLRRRDRAEDAGARRRDRRRLPDAVDHDAGVRPLHARERRRRHRHRLHGRRVDPRVRPRRGPRRRARDRRHVSREQGAEHPGLGRHAARPRRHRAGRDPPRRRGDGAGRPARGEGEGDRRAPRQVQADRRHAGATASPRSRSTRTRAARTSCSSCGARTATSRSGSSASRFCRTSAVIDRMLAEARTRIAALHARRGRRGRRRPARRSCARATSGAPLESSRARSMCARSVLEWRADPTSASHDPSLARQAARARLRRGLLVEPRCRDARRARRRRRRPRRRLRGLGRPRGCRWNGMKIDRDRLVDTASRLVNVHSFTGDEERMAELMARDLRRHGAAGAAPAGRGQPRERARHLGGRGRRRRR